MDKVCIDDKFAMFDEHRRPKMVAALNGQEVKLVKVMGVFPRHRHQREDEMFLVWKGRFRVEFRDRVVDMGPGEFVVVPQGVEHRTAADEEAEILVFEPAAVRNTGTSRTRGSRHRTAWSYEPGSTSTLFAYDGRMSGGHGMIGWR